MNQDEKKLRLVNVAIRLGITNEEAEEIFADINKLRKQAEKSANKKSEVKKDEKN